MSKLEQGCTRRRYEIGPQQLPLCCPLDDQRLWDAHPRVYLPIEKKGYITCPYCDSEYILKEV